MALNGAALAADVATLGNGGGLAVRSAALAQRAAKMVNKANDLYEKGSAVVENGGDFAEAMGEGDLRGMMRAGANLGAEALGGKRGKVGGKGNKPNARAGGGNTNVTESANGKVGDAAKKRGPKPKSEGGPHNEKIEEVGGQLGEGETLVGGGGRKPEVLIPTPGGNKTGRRPDVLVEMPDGSLRGTNVGKTKTDGSPIKREQEALDDLRGAGVDMDFVPYDR